MKVKRKHMKAAGVVLLLSLIVVPLAAYVYKHVIGYYEYRDVLSLQAASAPKNTTVVRLDLDNISLSNEVVSVGDMLMPASWHPTEATNARTGRPVLRFSFAGQRMQLFTSDDIDFDTWLQPMTPMGEILSKGFGSKDAFIQAFESDADRLSALVFARLQVGHRSGSDGLVEMPDTYKTCFLFPRYREYRKLAALQRCRYILLATGIPFIIARGEEEHYVFRGYTGGEIVSCSSSGAMIRSTVVSGKMDEQLVQVLCKLIEKGGIGVRVPGKVRIEPLGSEEQ